MRRVACLTMLGLALGLAPVDAQAGADTQLATAYKRSRTVAITGVMLGGAGLGTFIVAGEQGDGAVYTAVGLAALGAPMLAGGSMRARHLLRKMHRQTPQWAGLTSWGLALGAAGLGVTAFYYRSTSFAGISSLALFFGYAAGVVQLDFNARVGPRYYAQATVVPMVGADRVGLVWTVSL